MLPNCNILGNIVVCLQAREAPKAHMTLLCAYNCCLGAAHAQGASATCRASGSVPSVPETHPYTFYQVNSDCLLVHTCQQCCCWKSRRQMIVVEFAPKQLPGLAIL
jgi:hypothetical protein